MQLEIQASFDPIALGKYGPLVKGAWGSGAQFVEGSFLVDTGANSIGICSVVAEKLGLPPTRTSSAHGLGGITQAAYHNANLHLWVQNTATGVNEGGWLAVPVEAMAIKDMSLQHETYGAKVIGVLGRVFLQFAKLELDGTTSRLRILIDHEAISKPRPGQ